jgi:hypothetical protein
MDLSTLSDKETAALFRALDAKMKQAEANRKTEYGTLGADFLGHVVDTSPLIESETSDWAGYSEHGITFEHDGRKFSASIRITDVALKESRVEGKDFTPKKKTA